MTVALSAMVVLFVLLTGVSAQPAPASSRGRTDIAGATAEVRTDIGVAVKELNALRASVAEQRGPLATRLESLQKDVKGLRRDADRLRTVRELGRTEQDRLERETEALREECRFMQSLLSEYRRSLETRAGPAEARQLAPDLAAVDAVLGDEAAHGDLAKAAVQLLALAAKWNGAKIGGTAFEGAALDPDGVERTGTFTVFGPLTYFSGEGDPAGIVVSRLGSLYPSLFSALGESGIANIRRLADGVEATVPCDLTRGNALRVEEARQPFVEHLKKGGVVMVPLLAIGLVATLLSLWKLAELARIRTRPAILTNRILEQLRAGDVDGARATARRLPQPMALLMLEGVEHREAAKEHLEEIMHEHVLSCIPGLEKHLGTLAVLGGVAPLLGLLGTVTGMIHTFRLVTIFGSGNAKLLSAGISEALVTTECGLTIAIPVLLIHAFLARRVRNIIGLMERMAADFVHGLKLRSTNGASPSA